MPHRADVLPQSCPELLGKAHPARQQRQPWVALASPCCQPDPFPGVRIPARIRLSQPVRQAQLCVFSLPRVALGVEQ